MAVRYIESDLSEVISDSVRAYVAGFVDGEGYIGIAKTIDRRNDKNISRYYLRFTLAQIDPKPLIFMQKYFGGNIRVDKWKNKRTVYTYMLGPQHALRVIRSLSPFLVVKKDEAILAEEFGKTMVFTGKYPIPQAILDRREKIYWEMRALKHREFNLDGTIR